MTFRQAQKVNPGPSVYKTAARKSKFEPADDVPGEDASAGLSDPSNEHSRDAMQGQFREAVCSVSGVCTAILVADSTHFFKTI